jgi:ABC-type Fe3+-hydroxamate transport system substrate-binding protein
MNYTDQLGRLVQLSATPKRIISLVPSQTELLFDLGLREEVVGITKFCIHPDEWYRTKPRVGGTKNLNLNKIRYLQPDLIIANKEENEKLQLEELMIDFPVWVSDIYTLDDALQMIKTLGEITERANVSNQINEQILSSFMILQHKATQVEVKTTVYLIWNNPLMAAGRNTFISNMLSYCGFKNFIQGNDRYPAINEETIRILKPQYLLLSSEPFPFSEIHLNKFKALFPETVIILVDGEMFSWYGSRLLKASSYFEDLISQYHSTL